ncbi:MAG: hypothetical protein EAX90_00980 [Candidatus Heimdallarchaeota archaeon]|nr:hypothetical protein [Candidatus Heimdallarchaeota archaeon]
MSWVKEMNKELKLKGKYLGLPLPGLEPEVFAPGVVNTQHHEHSGPTFSPDGVEFYWSRWRRPDEGLPQVIMCMKQENGIWSKPEIASFSGKYSDGGPIFSYDGQKIFFYSKRPNLKSEQNDNNIWFVKRTPKGWSEVIKLDAPINSEKNQASPSIAKNGTLYYCNYSDRIDNLEILRSILKEKRYQKPEALGGHFNTEYMDWLPCIAHDESYIIYSSNGPDNIGRFDLYISFRSDDNQWSKPINLGEKINSKGSERFPSLTLDGKFLFFVRDSTIYWVSARIFDSFK